MNAHQRKCRKANHRDALDDIDCPQKILAGRGGNVVVDEGGIRRDFIAAERGGRARFGKPLFQRKQFLPRLVRNVIVGVQP